MNIKGTATEVWKHITGSLVSRKVAHRAHVLYFMYYRGKCCSNIPWVHFVGLSTGLTYLGLSSFTQEGQIVGRWFGGFWRLWEAENKNRRLTLLSTCWNILATPNVLLVQTGEWCMYGTACLNHSQYYIWQPLTIFFSCIHHIFLVFSMRDGCPSFYCYMNISL